MGIFVGAKAVFDQCELKHFNENLCFIEYLRLGLSRTQIRTAC